MLKEKKTKNKVRSENKNVYQILEICIHVYLFILVHIHSKHRRIGVYIFMPTQSGKQVVLFDINTNFRDRDMRFSSASA